MLLGFKPQLAIDSAKVKELHFPMILSEKFDGIRTICFNGVAYSRSLKPIPNLHIQKYFKDNAEALEGLDGELIVGDHNAKDVFNKTTSGVMSIQGEPEFTFWVFDKVIEGVPYLQRHNLIRDMELPKGCQKVATFLVKSQFGIDKLEQHFLAQGAEGVMLNDPEGLYKFGRAGTKNPSLIKIKRFKTEEFEIVGYEPKYMNTNEAKTNALGRTERSTSREGLVAMGTLGALVLKAPNGSTFSAGSGLNDATRLQLWKIRDTLKCKLASIKFFDVGDYEVPRFPVIRGIRDTIDL